MRPLFSTYNILLFSLDVIGITILCYLLDSPINVALIVGVSIVLTVAIHVRNVFKFKMRQSEDSE